MNKKSIVLLAFSNDRDSYLDTIIRERKNVYNAFRTHQDNGLIQVEKVEHTSINDFFEIFQRYQNQVIIFHYGGHASGSHLQFESTSRTSEQANATGLAQLIGQQKNLKLVFLNGCATSGQVEILLEAGVKTVIATHSAINDQKATEFAEQFYSFFTNGSSLLESFDSAVAYMNTRYKEQGISIRKGLKLKRAKNKDFPWGLYTNDEASLNWKLTSNISNTNTLALQLFNIGKRKLIEQDFYNAKLYFDKALVEDNTLIDAYLERGAVKLSMQQFHEAIIDLSYVIKKSPLNAIAYYNRGVAYFQLRNIDDAYQDWRKTKELGLDIADEGLQVCEEYFRQNN